MKSKNTDSAHSAGNIRAAALSANNTTRVRRATSTLSNKDKNERAIQQRLKNGYRASGEIEHDSVISHCDAQGLAQQRSAVPHDAMDEIDDLVMADQVLVGRNRTRRDINAQLRDLHGFCGADPQPGDRLVCLRNNHQRGLLNGSIWHTRTVRANGNDTVKLGITPDDNSEAAVIDVETHLAFFRGTAGRKLLQQREFDPFDFAYALTVHKAQGSQWPNVTIFNEAGVFGEHARRWLYTAITRAADRLTLVQRAEYEDEDD